MSTCCCHRRNGFPTCTANGARWLTLICLHTATDRPVTPILVCDTTNLQRVWAGSLVCLLSCCLLRSYCVFLECLGSASVLGLLPWPALDILNCFCLSSSEYGCFTLSAFAVCAVCFVLLNELQPRCDFAVWLWSFGEDGPFQSTYEQQLKGH